MFQYDSDGSDSQESNEEAELRRKKIEALKVSLKKEKKKDMLLSATFRQQEQQNSPPGLWNDLSELLPHPQRDNRLLFSVCLYVSTFTSYLVERL